MFKIYLVTNKIDSKVYVGQTSRTIEVRWMQHLREHIKLDIYFYNAIRKHGPENFAIKEIDQAETQQQANWLESFYIGLLRSHDPKYGYNGTFGGEGGMPTPETRLKISTNIKIALADHDIKEKMRLRSSGENNPMFGKHHSEETKLKISAANTGRKMPADQVEKIRISSTGRKHSEETKLKMSEGAKARNQVSNFTKNKAAKV